MKQRIQYIDRLKGFAILAVIFGHLCMWQLAGFQSPSRVVNTFHMSTFLFLSGFVISPPDLSKCVSKLFQFLLPAIIVGCVFALYMDSDFIHFLMHDSKFGYWYLFVLSGYYVLMMLYHYVNTYKGRKGVIMDISLAAIVFVGLASLHFLLGKKVSDLFCFYKMCTFWPVFFLGYMVKKYQKLKDSVFSNSGYTIAFIVYVICLFLDYRQFWYYLGIPMGMFAAMFFANLFSRREKQTSVVERELARLGRGSLDVYIFHYFLLWTISMRPLGDYLFETGNLLLYLLVSALLSVIIAYICLLIGYVLKVSPHIRLVIYGKR